MKELKIGWIALSSLLTIFVVAAMFSGFQNAGNTGTATVSQPVIYTAGVSQIFNNIGQSAHWLSYCTSGTFSGTLDLEQSVDGLTNWTPIAFASFVNSPVSGCSVLQAGGYYQNIRSTLSGGTLTVATYNASSGPISFSPAGVSSGGASAPTICTQSYTATSTAGATQVLFNGFANSSVRVCSFQISFSAAPSAGLVSFQGSTTPTTCAGLDTVWQVSIFSGTQPVVNAGSGIGALFAGPPAEALCLTNTTATNAVIDMTVAPINAAASLVFTPGNGRHGYFQ